MQLRRLSRAREAPEQPQRARPAVHAAGGGAAAAVPDLSAGPRRLARLHRCQGRPRRRNGSGSRTTSSCWATASRASRSSTRCSTRSSRASFKFAARPVARVAAQPQHPLQDLLPRGRAAALHRADGAVGDRVLVDLRLPVLDHQLGAGEARPDRPLHRLPGRPVERALLDDRRQRLARRALRRDLAARRAADDLAVATTKPRRSTARRRGSSSATSRCRCSRRSSRW